MESTLNPLFKAGDPFAIIVELDKALRSGSISDQSEALIFFQRLIKQFPLPVVITGAVLKLAELFRQGSNFIRLCVVRVFEHCDYQLGKILNTDEVIKRILSVSASNDAYARALTLRALAAMVRVVHNRVDVHHCIHRALESHQEAETYAALAAARRLGAHSKPFAQSVLDKVDSLLDDLTTSFPVKLKLLDIAGQMHHSVEMASKASAVCLRVIAAHPTLEFTVAVLNVLTRLAVVTMSNIPAQVERLVEHACSDARHLVRACALRNLEIVARRRPLHTSCFTTPRVHGVVQSCLAGDVPAPVQLACLDLLRTLTLAKLRPLRLITIDPPESGQHIFQILLLAMAATDSTVVARASLVAAHFCAGAKTEAGIGEFITAVVGGIVSCSQKDAATLVASLVHVAARCPTALDEVVDVLVSLLVTSEGSTFVAVARGLSRCNGVSIRRHLDSTLRSLITSSVDPACQEALLEVVMTACTGTAASHAPLLGLVEPALRAHASHVNLWSSYRAAVKALSRGFFDLAAALLDPCVAHVTSAQHHMWLSALRDCAAADSPASLQTLMQSSDRAAGLPRQHLLTALTSLKAARSSVVQFDFQTRFVQLRVAYLELIQYVVHLTQECPPNNIYRGDQTLRQDFERRVNIAVEMAMALGRDYDTLCQSFFNIDERSVELLSQHHLMCSVLACGVQLLFSPAPVLPLLAALMTQLAGVDGASETVATTAAFVVRNLHNIQSARDAGDDIPRKQYAREMIESILYTALPYPPIFFVFTAHPRPELHISNTPDIVRIADTLILKAWGLLPENLGSNVGRTLADIGITVDVVPRYLDGAAPVVAPLALRAKPRKGYYTKSFVAPLPALGEWRITVRISLWDTDDEEWTTATTSTINVRAVE